MTNLNQQFHFVKRLLTLTFRLSEIDVGKIDKQSKMAKKVEFRAIRIESESLPMQKSI